MYYHVIRSSKDNLAALELFINARTREGLLQPTLIEYRRTRKSRRQQPHTILMFPGYAFVKPEVADDLEHVKSRWTHHYIRSPLSQAPAKVPAEQVEYTMGVGRRLWSVGKGHRKNTRVIFQYGQLTGHKATVQKSTGHYSTVWVDNLTFPIICHNSDIKALTSTT